MRRVRVPQVVKPNARQIARLSEQADKFVSEAVRLERLTILLGNDVGLVRQPDPDPQKLFRLGEADAAQLVDNQGWEGDGSRPPALGFLEPDTFGGLFCALDDGELPTDKIDRGPAQSGDLAAPQSAHDREKDRRKHACAPEVSEQARSLLRV